MNALLVALACVMYERDVQLPLNTRVMFATSLREAEQRLVAGMVGKASAGRDSRLGRCPACGNAP